MVLQDYRGSFSRKLYVLDLQLWFHRRHRGLELGHANRPAGSVPRLSTNSSTFGAESDGKSYDIIRRQRSSNGVLSKYIASFSFDVVFASIILPKFKNDVSPIDPRCCAIVVFQSEPSLYRPDTERYYWLPSSCSYSKGLHKPRSFSGSATKKSRPDDHMPLIR
jgi:hypothetical protein